MGATLACTALYLLAPGFFAGVEKGLLRWKYAARGELPVDSSIVVIALTGDDIDALGGLPVKRSYYALALSALSGLGAGSVGVDLGLGDSGKSAPEYNDLLASVIASSGNVVLGGYFRSMAAPGAPDTHSTAPVFPARFACRFGTGNGNGNGTADGGGRGPWRTGFHFTLPYQPFLESAAGLGHTNITDDLTLPLFVATRSGVLPLFSLELLRRSVPGVAELSLGDGTLSLRGEGGFHEIPFGEGGDVTLNFTGGAGSLTVISFLDFLRAYDDLQAGGDGTLTANRPGAAGAPTIGNVRQLRDRIVLLGVVAEGRSSFVDSPFGRQFPAVGLHALFIDNAIHGRFLRAAPPGAVALVLLAIGLAGVLLIAPGRILRGVLAVVSLLALHTLVSFMLFSSAAFLLPMFVAWFSGAALIVVLLVHGQGVVGGQLAHLLATVGDRERRLSELRAALDRRGAEGDGAERARLTAEIERYRGEIEKLRLLGDDLRPWYPEEPVGGARPEGPGATAPADFHGLVHDPSGPMGAVVGLIRKISESDATVLITGESGSGKEVVARAIHESSARRGKPFVAVNCGALTETLLESELFGHERGAFTGAMKEKPGRFEIAQGGTIFLDEIGETSESFQVKLLRVLQDGTYERVGGTVTLRSDARVITATNRDLKSAVERKAFRADLYYRLNVLAAEIPPLRNRPGDIVVLSRKFLAEQGAEFAASGGVMKALAAHPWKGNVRELQSIITRGALLAKADGRTMLRLKDLPEEVAGTVQSQGDIGELVAGSLREKGFSRSAVTQTADELGGFNRGTVAEYFRGYCFDTLVAEGYDVARAASRIAGSDDAATVARVAKKLDEYIRNAGEFADPASPLEIALERSKPKFKNLPQKYHGSLELIIRKAHGGGLNA